MALQRLLEGGSLRDLIPVSSPPKTRESEAPATSEELASSKRSILKAVEQGLTLVGRACEEEFSAVEARMTKLDSKVTEGHTQLAAADAAQEARIRGLEGKINEAERIVTDLSREQSESKGEITRLKNLLKANSSPGGGGGNMKRLCWRQHSICLGGPYITALPRAAQSMGTSWPEKGWLYRQPRVGLRKC